MKKLLPLFVAALVAGLVWRYWPSEDPIEAAGTNGEDPPAESGAVGGAAGEAGPARVIPLGPPSGADRVEDAAAAAPAPVEDRAALRVLDRWHRALDRSAAPAGAPAGIAEAIGAFAGIWDDRGGAYAADLRLGVPDALGASFAAYAEAFAAGGVTALDRALREAGSRDPAWMAWTEALVHEALSDQQEALAGPALGRLLAAMEEDDYDRERILQLQEYAAVLRSRARSWMPAEDYLVASGDSLDRICRRYREKGLLLRHGWLQEFNGLRNDRIRIDQKLRIPREELHVLGLRSKCLLVLLAGETPLRIYEVSYGKPGHETPVGRFTATVFEYEPVDWGLDPPVPYGHPDHRLGSRWMGFEEDKAYGIHGNNCDDRVGAYESGGCVRMKNAEVEELFELLPIGAEVEIRA